MSCFFPDGMIVDMETVSKFSKGVKMKDIATLNDELRTKIVNMIETFEKENGIELTVLKAYSYFSIVKKAKEIHIALGLKE